MTVGTMLDVAPRSWRRRRSEAEAAPGSAARINPLVRIGFAAWVASIPFELPQRTTPLEVPAITGIVFLLLTLLNPSACYGRVPGAVRWFLAYLWIFGASAVAHSLDQGALALRLFLNLLQLILILWAGGNLLADQRTWRMAIVTLVAACAVRAALQLSGIATVEYVLWTGGVRVTTLGQNTNLAALIMAAGMGAAVALAAGRDPDLPRARLAGAIVALGLGAAIIQTGSRGGLLGGGAGLLALLLLRPSTPAQALRNAILAVAAVGLLGWGAVRTEGMRNRLLDSAAEGHFAGRERIYPAVLEMVAERPLFGWGPLDNQFELARRLGEKGRISRDAHNLVLELLTAGGLLGAAPFLLGMGLCLGGAWRARHGPRGALPVAVLAVVLVGTLAGTWIAGRIVWLALAFGLAAGTTVPRRTSGAAPWSAWRCAA